MGRARSTVTACASVQPAHRHVRRCVKTECTSASRGRTNNIRGTNTCNRRGQAKSCVLQSLHVPHNVTRVPRRRRLRKRRLQFTNVPSNRRSNRSLTWSGLQKMGGLQNLHPRNLYVCGLQELGLLQRPRENGFTGTQKNQ